MELEVRIHKAEEGGYWAEVPSIPGCMTQDDSIRELFENIHEAVEGCLLVKVEGCLLVKEDMFYEKLLSTTDNFEFDMDKCREYSDLLEKLLTDIDAIKNVDFALPLLSAEQRA